MALNAISFLVYTDNRAMKQRLINVLIVSSRPSGMGFGLSFLYFYTLCMRESKALERLV